MHSHVFLIKFLPHPGQVHWFEDLKNTSPVLFSRKVVVYGSLQLAISEFYFRKAVSEELLNIGSSQCTQIITSDASASKPYVLLLPHYKPYTSDCIHTLHARNDYNSVLFLAATSYVCFCKNIPAPVSRVSARILMWFSDTLCLSLNCLHHPVKSRFMTLTFSFICQEVYLRFGLEHFPLHVGILNEKKKLFDIHQHRIISLLP